MNPIKNKKDLEKTIAEIRNFAYSYLEKYSPSKQQLRIYLFKKLIKTKQNISLFPMEEELHHQFLIPIGL